ncbi:hypothetical protein BU25DRAFT_464148 [Macroventuria anomochaeta]|uniref:Uncharacterized protein n=1 Tax=Macroventuria anomochaeta TaxID=301207 RepID=A0ACB6SIK6_9PLEO|nr:uncharacterized protein BU25DRAFT_464148 [Macroventuria anomochaeta]KAF2633218.1 hypothetical protein BU25DRAFT_464148 [Macroventuria anomochaeta]
MRLYCETYMLKEGFTWLITSTVLKRVYYWNLLQKDTQAGSCPLKNFTYTAARVPEDIRRTTETLFETIEGLRHITLGATEGDLPILRSLERTGKSLKYLELYAAVHDRVYSASELKQLVSSCQRLTRLRLSLGDFSSVIDSMGILEPCNLSDSDSLEESIAVLAQHPTLESPELASHPLLRGYHTILERR